MRQPPVSVQPDAESGVTKDLTAAWFPGQSLHVPAAHGAQLPAPPGQSAQNVPSGAALPVHFPAPSQLSCRSQLDFGAEPHAVPMGFGWSMHLPSCPQVLSAHSVAWAAQSLSPVHSGAPPLPPVPPLLVVPAPPPVSSFSSLGALMREHPPSRRSEGSPKAAEAKRRFILGPSVP